MLEEFRSALRREGRLAQEPSRNSSRLCMYTARLESEERSLCDRVGSLLDSKRVCDFHESPKISLVTCDLKVSPSEKLAPRSTAAKSKEVLVGGEQNNVIN